MGMRADRDLWSQALAIESRYGNAGPHVVARMIDEYRCQGDFSEAAFWGDVADCLRELCRIRGPNAASSSIRGPAGDRPAPQLIPGQPSTSDEDVISAG